MRPSHRLIGTTSQLARFNVPVTEPEPPSPQPPQPSVPHNPQFPFRQPNVAPVNNAHAMRNTYSNPQSAVAASSAAAGGPPSSASKYDKDFGDGSDMTDLDVDGLVATATNIKHTYVKVEPQVQQPQQQQYLPPPPPPHQPVQSATSFSAPPQTSNSINGAIPQHRAPTSFAGQSIVSNTSAAASSASIAAVSTVATSSISVASSSHTAATHALSDAVRIAQLELELNERKGEAKILRNRLEAFERRKTTEAVNAIKQQSLSPAITGSNFPSSSQLQHPRKNDADSQQLQRITQQMEVLKAARESSDMQSQEYARENQQLREKMEAMVKTQQQSLWQAKKQGAAASANSPQTHVNNVAGRPSPTISSHTTTIVAAPTASHGNSTSISQTITTPSHLTRTAASYDSSQWQPPTYLSQLTLRSDNPAMLQSLSTRIDVPLLSQLQHDLNHVCSDANEIVQRAGQHLASSLQLVLSQTSSLLCVLTPLRQMLFACSSLATATSSPHLTSSAQSISPTNLPSTPSRRNTVKSESKSSDGWDRQVRVKSEHVHSGSGSASGSKLIVPHPSSSSSGSKRNSNTRDSKPPRALLFLLVQIAHYCVAHDSRCSQVIYQDLCAEDEVTAPSPTAECIDVSSEDSDASFEACWKWQPVSQPKVKTEAAKHRPVTPRSKIEEAMSWCIVLPSLFDDAMQKLYVERDRSSPSYYSSSSSSSSSSSALQIVECLLAILRIVSHIGVPVSSSSVSHDVLYSAWIPRFAQVITRIHANVAQKSPISVSSSMKALEAHIQLFIAQIIDSWSHQSRSPLTTLLHPALHIPLPDSVKSSSLEPAMTCTCSLMRLLLMFLMKQANSQATPPQLHTVRNLVEPPPLWIDLALNLIEAEQRIYPHASKDLHLSVCTLHRGDWGERDLDVSLLESTAALFGLSFAHFRVALAIFIDSVTQLQHSTQARVCQLTTRSDSNDASSPFYPILHAISSSLRILSTSLRTHQRRWRDLQSDSEWLHSIRMCRTDADQDLRLDTLLKEMPEACQAVQQCRNQLRAMEAQANMTTDEQEQHAWNGAARLASELRAWFTG